MARLPWPSAIMDLARWRYARGQGWQPHQHDFFEIFWVEHGSCMHRMGGRDELVGANELIWLQPDDEHVGWAPDDAGVIFVNLSVGRDVVADLRDRYGSSFLLWDADRPYRHRITTQDVRDLGALVAETDAGSPSDRDLLLLRLGRAVRSPAELDLGRLPSWLRDGIQALEADAAWSEGVSGLARRCGRGREHCHRTLRRLVGMSATELLQGMRLRTAARLLVMEDLPVVAVAVAAGFTSLAHFYTLFHRAYHETPASYRRQRRMSGPSGAAPRTMVIA